MTEQTKEPGTAAGGEPQDPTTDPKVQPNQGGVDVDRAARKYRKQAEAADKRAAELEARLKAFEDQQKTEQEKAIEAARKAEREAVTNEFAQKLTATQTRAALIADLSDRGLPSWLAPAVAEQTEINEPGDVKEAVSRWAEEKKDYLAKLNAKPVGPTPPGMPTAPGGQKTIDIAHASRQELEANQEQVMRQIMERLNG